jgi:alkylated DNA nucleotide flippase Atl1
VSELTTREHILAIVETIPPGHATTYGSIADRVDGATARSVGHTLKTDGHHVPWWRVVSASGRPAPGAEQIALEHYRAENTPLKMHEDGTYSVDLAASSCS